MFDIERQSKIIDILQKENSITVHKLAKVLYVSESTVRRDLTSLEKTGKVLRTFGGVVLSKAAEKEVPLVYRKSLYMKEKNIIAQKAISYIHNGDVIFLDASSSAACIVQYLPNFQDITVISNNPLTSVALGEMKIKNYCTGGLLLNNSIAYVGGKAVDFISNINADIIFFSCRGVSVEGILSDSSAEETEIKLKMMEQSRKKIFLCDKSKIGLTFMHRLCCVDALNAVISE